MILDPPPPSLTQLVGLNGGPLVVTISPQLSIRPQVSRIDKILIRQKYHTQQEPQPPFVEPLIDPLGSGPGSHLDA